MSSAMEGRGGPNGPRGRATAMLVAMALGSIPVAVVAQGSTRFVGTWVEDQSKRTMGAERSLTFRQSANGGIEELRGSYARPLVQPVRFGVPAYAVDGSRNSIAWKQLSPSQFERVISQSGVALNTRRIQISPDGKVLTEVTEEQTGGKKSTLTIVYRRTSAEGQGLVGMWKPESRKSDPSNVMQIAAAGTGLKVTNNPDRPGRNEFTLLFDGKPATVDGPTVISGTTTSGRRVDESTIQLALAREGVPTGTATWTLSPDSKTLTSRAMVVGPDASKEPTITVFARQ